jgi:hypothetical protein
MEWRGKVTELRVKDEESIKGGEVLKNVINNLKGDGIGHFQGMLLP